jgi:integrase/recombinase XerD
MVLEDIVRSPRRRALAREGPLGPYVDGFVAAVTMIGYTPASLRDLLSGVIQFGTFLKSRRKRDLRQLSAADVEAFIATQPVVSSCAGKYRYHMSRGVRGARHLIRHARAAGIVAAPPPRAPPRYAPVLDEWLTFLEHHRGLAAGSLDLYRRHIRRFLEFVGPDATLFGLRRLDPGRIREYVCWAAEGRSRSERKAIVSTLRIFLRFMWERGHLRRNLAESIERVPCFKHDRLPRGPRWEDARRLLDTPDCSTTLGRRDHAILQLLLGYGIRAEQVCRLRLEDIAWRRGTIRFAPLKQGRPVEAPILALVGEAILAYLQAGRPAVADRRVFRSTRPPFGALTRSAITGLVARAFVRSGVSSPHRGSHALRHAWATRLLAVGQPLKTIADLLGHRSLETTRIYAKVDFLQLRTVGLPWPKAVAK